MTLARGIAGLMVLVALVPADCRQFYAQEDRNDKGIDVEPVFNTQSGQFRALLVGVNDYERLKDLKCCEADVTALRDRLVAMGFRPGTIKCLTTADRDPAYRPNYRNITERLDAMFAGLREDAVLVIALSGHGGSFEWKDTSGEVQKASFYCPQDARLQDPHHTMVPTEDIYDRLEKCPARFKMLLVDACRDRHFVPDDAPLAGHTAVDEAKSMAEFTKSLLDPSRLPKGTLAMISCSSDEQSYEDPKLGHGIFMYYVLEGLAGQADRTYRGDGNKLVSYRELEDFVYRNTSDHAWAKHERAQTPKFYAKWELPNFNLVEVPGPTVYTAWPFDSQEAKRRQEETAKALGQPVEVTNSIGMKLKLIPAGEFLMGSPESDKDAHSNERPQHRVRITRPFHLGMHEVTLGQFLNFYHAAKYKIDVERNGKGGHGWTGDNFEQRKSFVPWSWGFDGQTYDHPVVNVSWNDAVAFCQWLSEKEDRKYRLPTEAEWEYACRAGLRERFHFGNDDEDLVHNANVGDQSMRRMVGDGFFVEWRDGESAGALIPFPYLSKTDGYGFSAPVAQFRPNGFGLYDMHGNVWEWCQDRYAGDYYANSPPADPPGAAGGSRRVNRGGSWHCFAGICRSAGRSGTSPSDLDYGQGFRVARSLSGR